ncbi:MAG TPA: phosphate ABC transporter permease subunit PstC [Candidatus Eremiobacteraceae bacterium]
MSQQSVDIAPISIPVARPRMLRASTRVGDRAFGAAVHAAAWVVLLVVAGLFVVLFVSAWPALSTVPISSIANFTWDPTDGKYGVLPFVFGTVVTSAIALLIAGPIGIACALFLSELASRRLAGPLGMLVELLAAVPSVVYGLWGLFVLAPVMRTTVEPFLSKTLGFLPQFQGPIYGVGMLTGGVLLSIMILPTVAAISRDVFTAVPIDQREAMLALGATKWEVLSKAVLPYARSGVIGALVLALGRALGEAMAVVMVIGNKPAIAASLFAPGYTMASVLALEFTEATGRQYVAMLIEVGLLLFVLSIVINVIARTLVWSVASGPRAGRK